MNRALLSLGSNQSPQANLARAVRALRERFGTLLLSTVYRTRAVGFDGSDFLNAGALIQTSLEPEALNIWLHALEDAHGRDRSGPRFGDRTLDIDIVLYEDRVMQGPGNLRLPRPDLRHAFVLRPLAEIAPGFVDPLSGLDLATLWARSPHRDEPMPAVSLDGD